MANASEQPSSLDSELPPPELNPLLNPVLEQNLGRWAEVYFKSPPEQRNQAVEELLRELEAGTPRSETSQPANGSLTQPASSTVKAEESDKELDWLRSKNLSLAYEYNESAPRWIWKVLAPVLALLVAGFLYSQWKTRLTAQQHTEPAAAVAQAPPVAPSEALPTQSGTPAVENPLVPTPGVKPQTAPPTPQPLQRASIRQPLGPPSDVSTPGGAGELELQRAQNYLEGRGSPRDASSAADWLWTAVRKENAAAEVLLADLYTRGDGVAKNCEQARLLLVAAAKRGQPAAADKLRNLESGGCS